MVSKGNYPQMAAKFRLVNHYDLPRYIQQKSQLLQLWLFKTNRDLTNEQGDTLW